MFQVPDPQGRALLERLLSDHPEWAEGYVPGIPSSEAGQARDPRLVISSAHPEIRTPLTIELGGTLQLFWYEGYFYDFVGLRARRAEEAYDFLNRLFEERTLRMVCWKGGKVIAGGPAELDEVEEWLVPWTWNPEYELIQFRSWRGTHDRDIPGSGIYL